MELHFMVKSLERELALRKVERRSARWRPAESGLSAQSKGAGRPSPARRIDLHPYFGEQDLLGREGAG